jgi:hypothetical protein
MAYPNLLSSSGISTAPLNPSYGSTQRQLISNEALDLNLALYYVSFPLYARYRFYHPDLY